MEIQEKTLKHPEDNVTIRKGQEKSLELFEEISQ